MLKSIAYFKFKTVEIGNSQEVEAIVMDTFQQVSLGGTKIDLLFTEQLNISKFVELLSEGKLHNDSMILLEGIHQNKHQQKNWENLIASPNITVSIDMFHCGAIFIRKEQVKEHFTIRI